MARAFSARDDRLSVFSRMEMCRRCAVAAAHHAIDD